MELKETDQKVLAEVKPYMEELKAMRQGNIAPFQERLANNPALMKAFVTGYRLGYNDDFTLPRKVVELIMLALGASQGATTTIKAHSAAAIKAGATLEEVADVLRLVFFACGVTSLIPAAEVFAQLSEPSK